MDSFPMNPSAWVDSVGFDIGHVAWAGVLFCVLGLVLGLVDRLRRDLSPAGPRDIVILLCLAAALLLGSLWGLPTESYTYTGHDAQLLDSLQQLGASPEFPADPGVDSGSNVSRLFFGITALGTQLYAKAIPGTSSNLTGSFRHWLLVTLLIGVLAMWLAYAIARSWGAPRWSAALGVAVGMLGPALFFHSNCLTDHLLAALVTVAAVHLQTRRLVEGRLLTGWALLEGWALVGAGFYTRYTSVIIFVPLALARMWSPKGSLARRTLHTIGLGLGVGLLTVAELPRLARISPELQQNHVFREYGGESVSFVSLHNLFSSFSFGSLTDFLSPLGSPGFVLLSVIGVWKLAQGKTSTELRAILLLLLSVFLIVAVNFMHIHPGTRSLLHLFLLAPVVLAIGFEHLFRAAKFGRIGGWLLIGGALALTLPPWLESNRVLRSDWITGGSVVFDEVAESLPKLTRAQTVRQLHLWADGRQFNILTNDSGNSDAFRALRLSHGPDQVRYFGQPAILGSSRFIERPTLYFATTDDFRWSTTFRRDYFVRASHGLTLIPAFCIEGRWLVYVAGPRAAPPIPWESQ
jgi:hypothetical protein